MKQPKVKILILNYNGSSVLKKCLDSVLDINYSNYSTVLIDNCSTDNSLDLVKSHYASIEVVQTGENRMYAGGYNYFFNRNSEDCFYMILNNDTVVDKDILNQFILGVRKYGDKHIYGAKIMFAKNKNKVWYSGSKIDLNKGIIKHLNIRKDINDLDLKDSLTDYVTGCCMFVHSSTIGKLKGFDESFKMYMEDVDFCLRAKSEGINSYFLSSPLLYHFVSSSVKNKAFKILLSYTKLSIRYTGVFCLFNVPLFILRKILSK